MRRRRLVRLVLALAVLFVAWQFARAGWFPVIFGYGTLGYLIVRAAPGVGKDWRRLRAAVKW
jgi:hypothetical protein